MSRLPDPPDRPDVRPSDRDTAPAPHGLPLSTLLVGAARALAAVQSGRSLGDALQALGAEVRPGAQALSFEALRHWAGARAVLRVLAPRAPAAPVEALLLAALAQAWPGAAHAHAPHTLVDQAVAAARRLDARSAGFVNAVLRRFLREGEALLADLTARHEEVRHGHPAWWIERLRRDWPQDWAAMLAHNRIAPPMWLRVNTRRVAPADYLRQLQSAGLSARPSPGQPQALCLDTPVPVTRLPGFAAGLVSVQDLSAQRAAGLLLGPAPGAGAGSSMGATLPAGAHVLDACAAPGGKTAHLLEVADLDLLALDRDAARLAKVDSGLQRLGLSARTRAADARETATWWDGRPFDAILLDAPCTASGIVRRHPDVPWLRRPADVAALAAEQAALLDALWPLLAPGGRLLYATCSVFRAEGQHQIEAFMQRTPGARSSLLPGHAHGLPDNRSREATQAPAGEEAASGGGEPAPGDGFFYARIDRSD